MTYIKIEKTIIKMIHPAKEFSPLALYWIIKGEELRLTLEGLRRALARMVHRNILNVYRDKTGALMYFLSEQGIVIQNYFYPFPGEILSLEYTTVLETPQKASEETGYSINSIRKKRIKDLHYITTGHKLYILKKEKVSDLLNDIPAFPIISDIYELMHVFPEPAQSLNKFLVGLQNKEKKWLWPEVLKMILATGHYIHQDSGRKEKFGYERTNQIKKYSAN